MGERLKDIFPGIEPGMVFLAPRHQNDGPRAFEYIDSASFVVLRKRHASYNILILDGGMSAHKAGATVDMRLKLEEWRTKGWMVIGS